MVQPANKEKAIQVITNILKCLHAGRYEDIEDCVDESEESNWNALRAGVQGILAMNGFGTIDEYGIPCNFHPAYEYSQISFFELDDNSGFVVDYDLTSDSELVDICLQTKFLCSEQELKSIFVSLDPR